ncbi:MAG: toxin-antitoxin system YwqK family antitoxin [Bacteroidetes bacterium]|nr:toxin-antitoxin system YwqK family antitoxin [Bacteroidota bacterium]
MSFKKFFLPLLFFCPVFSFAGLDTNKVDGSGLRQGYWIIYNTIKKLPDYPSDAKVEEGHYADSKKNGMWKIYYPGGSIKCEVTYFNNRPNGYAKIFNENGSMAEEGEWKNNRWVGTFKSYHENGQTFMDFNYNNGGKREGEQKYFYENGQLMMKGNMKEGKENGKWDGYYENGDKREEKIFNDGALDAEKTKVYEPTARVFIKTEVSSSKEPTKIVDIKVEKTNEAQKPFDGNGYAKLFNTNKRVSKDGLFRNYRLIDGKDYIYNDKGNLERIALYKDGKYIGESPIEQKDIENDVLVMPEH